MRLYVPLAVELSRPITLAMPKPVPKVTLAPLMVRASPRLKTNLPPEEIDRLLAIVPVPPMAAPEATVTVAVLAFEPLMSSVPALTVVVPV